MYLQKLFPLHCDYLQLRNLEIHDFFQVKHKFGHLLYLATLLCTRPSGYLNTMQSSNLKSATGGTSTTSNFTRTLFSEYPNAPGYSHWFKNCQCELGLFNNHGYYASYPSLSDYQSFPSDMESQIGSQPISHRNVSQNGIEPSFGWDEHAGSSMYHAGQVDHNYDLTKSLDV